MNAAAARPCAHDFCPCRFQQLPVFHAGGTRRLARATTQTTLDMRFKRRRLNRQTLFLDRAHQVKAAARAVVLVPRGYISWTGFQTKTPMNTCEKFFFLGGEGLSLMW